MADSSRGLLSLAAAALVGLGLGYAAGTSGSDGAGEPAPTARPGTAPETQDAERQLRAVLEESVDLPRTERLLDLLVSLGPDDVEMTRSVLHDPLTHMGPLEVLLLAQFWAHHEPHAAADWSGGIKVGMMRMATLELSIERLAEVDPQAALPYMGGNAVEAYRPLAQALVRGWYRSGEPGLVDWIRDRGEGFLRQSLLGTLARARIRSDGADAAIAWAEGLPDEDRSFKLDAFRRLGSELGYADPAAGMAFCKEHCAGPFGSNLRSRTASAWAEIEGAPAMEWLAEAPPGTERELAVLDTYRAWQSARRDEAMAWLESIGRENVEPWLQPAVGLYARLRANTDFTDALEWVAILEDPDKKRTAMSQIARRWYRSDPETARAWIEQSPLSEEDRAQAMAPPEKGKRRRGADS